MKKAVILASQLFLQYIIYSFEQLPNYAKLLTILLLLKSLKKKE